jgi:hypothetical protein
MTSRYKQDDISLLLPFMQVRVQLLLDRMKELDFKPVLFDGMRTSEEAAKNAAKGTGIVHSVHLLGLAADVICDEHGWQCRAKKCKFYTNLVREAKDLGFVCGADFSSVDEPHVQACFVADQGRLRATPEKLLDREAELFFELRDAAIDLRDEPSPETLVAFQKAAGLKPDGVKGPITSRHLAAALRKF